MINEIFDSCMRPAGDMAGVFEYDGETGYFYLYRVDGVEGHKIIGSILVTVGAVDFSESDVEIHWKRNNQLVGLIIQGQVCAVFDVEGRRMYGGKGMGSSEAGMPQDIERQFIS